MKKILLITCLTTMISGCMLFLSRAPIPIKLEANEQSSCDYDFEYFYKESSKSQMTAKLNVKEDKVLDNARFYLNSLGWVINPGSDKSLLTKKSTSSSLISVNKIDSLGVERQEGYYFSTFERGIGMPEKSFKFLWIQYYSFDVPKEVKNIPEFAREKLCRMFEAINK